MASLKTKLSRLSFGSSSSPFGAPEVPAAPAPKERGPFSRDDRPSLEELRRRVAAIVARGNPTTPRSDPTRGELPFARTETADGPLYLHRARALPGAKVGRFPLHAAGHASPDLLALFAMDPAIAGCDPKRALYLDTETTGLAGGTGTVPFLIGLSFFDEGSNAWVTEQLLLRRLGEETPMLRVLSERVAAASMVVTYNGKSFDVPLLRTRLVMNRLPALAWPPHLDLVHVARRLHARRLSVRTLVAVENSVLGAERVGDVGGADIVALYAHFLRTGDESALVGVVRHNELDVLSMVALVGLYGEPLGSMNALDLADAAHTAKRTGALEIARHFAEQAIAKGAGHEAIRTRGDIHKARGDKDAALLDYEAVHRETSCSKIRLELAKLYEHHARAYTEALAMVEQGTSEDRDAHEKRRDRLAKKAARIL